MGKHSTPKDERGNPSQGAGRHRRAEQNFVVEGEQSVSRILNRLAAERLPCDPRKA